MDPRPEQLNRQQLYDAVWSEPVTTVASRYGLSDVGLAKICKRLRIPVPSRGYWAKVNAGASVRRPPLPNPDNAAPTGLTLPSVDSMASAQRIAAKQAAAKGREANANINVPPTLQHPHPLIRAASARLKQQDGWTDERGLRSAAAEVLHLYVTRSALDRALLIMDTLIKALAERSITVRVDAKAKCTLIDAEGTSIPLMISEHVRQTDHQLTPAEQKARERYTNRSHWAPSALSYPHTARYDYHPTGTLTVTAGRWPCRHWNDTPRTPLERRLGEIVVGIMSVAAATKAREDDQPRRQEAHRLAQERYQLLKQRLA